MTTRNVQSHDAGMQAHDDGQARNTYTSDFWIDRASWLAGWDSAADLKANPPADWDDVQVTLPVRSEEQKRLHRVRSTIIQASQGHRLTTPRYVEIIRENGCDHFQCGPHIVVCTRNHRFAIALIDTCANGHIVGDIV